MKCTWPISLITLLCRYPMINYDIMFTTDSAGTMSFNFPLQLTEQNVPETESDQYLNCFVSLPCCTQTLTDLLKNIDISGKYTNP